MGLVDERRTPSTVGCLTWKTEGGLGPARPRIKRGKARVKEDAARPGSTSGIRGDLETASLRRDLRPALDYSRFATSSQANA